MMTAISWKKLGTTVERLSLQTVGILFVIFESSKTHQITKIAETLGDYWLLPNAEFNREKGLTSIQHGLEVLKGEKLRWPGAGLLNLCVRLSADGQPEIHRFKRCSFCEHQERGVTINEPWNTWYRSLAVIGKD